MSITPFNKTTAESGIRAVIRVVDQNWGREGLAETPTRYINFLEEFLNPKPFSFTTFTEEGANEMIVVHNIPFYSLCEHHLAPFFGVAHVAYIPKNDLIVGLSKIPRLVEHCSQQLTNQERVGRDIAEKLMSNLNPAGVGVILRARHLCVEMRGVKKPGTETTTSYMSGRFKENINTRQEFLNLIK